MSKLEMLELAKAKEYLTIQDVALLSNLSKSTVVRNIEIGKLKAIQPKPYQRTIIKKTDF